MLMLHKALNLSPCLSSPSSVYYLYYYINEHTMTPKDVTKKGETLPKVNTAVASNHQLDQLAPEEYLIYSDRNPNIACWATRSYFDGSDCDFLSDYNEDGLCPIVLGDVLSGEDLVSKGSHALSRSLGN